MTEQKCVRTYDKDIPNYGCSLTDKCSNELNTYLEYGWKVILVTPKTGYSEYIIEREIDNSRME